MVIATLLTSYTSSRSTCHQDGAVLLVVAQSISFVEKFPSLARKASNVAPGKPDQVCLELCVAVPLTAILGLRRTIPEKKSNC